MNNEELQEAINTTVSQIGGAPFYKPSPELVGKLTHHLDELLREQRSRAKKEAQQ